MDCGVYCCSQQVVTPNSEHNFNKGHENKDCLNFIGLGNVEIEKLGGKQKN